MSSSLTRPHLGALILLALVLAAAKPAADPVGALFAFEPADVQLRTRAWQTPKAKSESAEALALELAEDETFVLTLEEGTELSGSWTRKSPSSSRISLTLDAAGEDALRAHLGQRVADQLLPPFAQTGPADLELTKLRLKLRLVTDKATGDLWAKLVLRVRAKGGLQPAGPDALPLKTAWKIVGTSVPVTQG
mgnify:CR=1 FL=1